MYNVLKENPREEHCEQIFPSFEKKKNNSIFTSSCFTYYYTSYCYYTKLSELEIVLQFLNGSSVNIDSLTTMVNWEERD